jgi:DNA-binding transcriptional ArsR family regulator
MARQGSTKKKILKLISGGSDNLSAISEALDLAPSTVSKHLHDLEVSGAIEQKDNPHVKKWKYYTLNNRSAPGQGRGGSTADRRITLIAATTIALILFAAASYLLYAQSAAAKAYIPISITDPPQVPAGTQALYVNYSSLSVHFVGGNGGRWVPVNSSGRLDLMSLINESQVIGSVGINSSSSIDMVRFNISFASIRIDNITYDVGIMSRQVTARTINNAVNESSGILLDFQPVVDPVYLQNSTMFVLLPSLRAAIVHNPGQTGKQFSNPGGQAQRYPLQQDYRKIFPSTNANLSITNAALNSSDNSTSFSLSVRNLGGGNVIIMGVLLYGNETLAEMPGPMMGNGTATLNMSDGCAHSRFSNRSDQGFSINASSIYAVGAYTGARMIRIRLRAPVSNISICDIGNSPGPKFFDNGGFGAVPPYMMHGVDFIVGENGTLLTPSPRMVSWHREALGYVLQPQESATLTYDGEIRMMGGLPTALRSGAYSVVVMTDAGMARANFTNAAQGS